MHSKLLNPAPRRFFDTSVELANITPRYILKIRVLDLSISERQDGMFKISPTLSA